MTILRLTTTRRAELVEITELLQEAVRASGVREGALLVQSLHTTAALTINENADPDVVHDLLGKLERMVPKHEGFYEHAEGNSDSHMKTSLFGPSLMVVISEGRLLLGTWQGVYFCEWDGPRERKVAVQVLAAAG